MAEIGIHLDDRSRSTGEGDAEAVEIGAPESLLDGSVPDTDPRIGGGELVRQASGPIGRLVVDDEQDGRREGSEDRRRDRADVLGFVVGGQDHPDALARRAHHRLGCGRGWGGHGRQV